MAGIFMLSRGSWGFDPGGPPVETGKPRAIAAGGGQSIRPNDGPTALFSMRLQSGQDDKTLVNIGFALAVRGNANGTFYWSFQINPTLSNDPAWEQVPNSVVEYRLLGRGDDVTADGTTLCAGPGLGRQYSEHALPYTLTGTEELVMVITGENSNLTYSVGANWQEQL